MIVLISIPYLPDYSDIEYLVENALQSNGLTVVATKNIVTNEAIVDQVHEVITSADLIVADVTSGSPNVMYELGVAINANIPVLLLIQTGNTVPFYLGNYRAMYYDPMDIWDSLGPTLTKYLANPDFINYFKADTAAFKETAELRKTVFISYSHEDKKYLKKLQVHLKSIAKEGTIEIWDDTKIKAGERGEAEIRLALERASIAILLVSANFLASEFITKNELPPLLKEAENNGVIILSLIVGHCQFLNNSNLSIFQAINKPLEPLSALNDNDQDFFFNEVVNRIAEIVNQ